MPLPCTLKPLFMLLYGCLLGSVLSSTFYLCLSGIFIDDSNVLQAESVLQAKRSPRTYSRREADTPSDFVSVVQASGLPLKREIFNGVVEMIATFNSPINSEVGTPQTIATEYKQRRTLLVAVLSSRGDLERTEALIRETWGAGRASNYRIFAADRVKQDKPTDPRVWTTSSKAFNSNTRLSFGLLKYLQTQYSKDYSWFIILPENTFISIQDMENLLKDIDSSAAVYMGKPSSDNVIAMAKWRLMANEYFCESGPGIVLSRAALEAVYPHLDDCLKMAAEFGIIGQPDVELGRCLSRKVGIHCSTSKEVLQYFVEDVQNESLQLQRLWSSPLFRDLITLHPIHSSKHMKHILYYCRARHFNQMHRKVSALKRQTCKWYQSTRQDAQTFISSLNCSSLQENYTIHLSERFYPKNKFEIKPWTHMDSTHMHIANGNNPVIPIVGEDLDEFDYTLKEAVDILSKKDSVSYKQQKLENGYVRYSAFHGREYILDISMRNRDAIVHRRISLIRTHQSPHVIVVPESQKETQKVNFIVPLSDVSLRFKEFLRIYEDLCLKILSSASCRLVLAVFGKDEIKDVTERLHRVTIKYPHFEYIIVPSSDQFTRAKAMDIGMAVLNSNDLAFLCDVDMSIDLEFLNRCRLNTILGRRVYYPIFFKYYNMDYVYRLKRKPATLGIKREHGHWASYSYGMLCIYKSDYIHAGGFDKSITGWGGEDIDLLNSILKVKLEVLRAPDPALGHRYHDKLCSAKLQPMQLSMCISSRSESLADRMQLANYVFYLEEKYGVTRRSLWQY